MPVEGLQEKARSISGSATHEEKERIFLWTHVLQEMFAGDILRQVVPKQFDVERGKDGDKRDSGTLVCEIIVTSEMANGYNIMHGGCCAYLVDVCTSLLLSAFMQSHVTLNLNLDYHSPVPVGATIEIVSTTRALGKRVLSTRCELVHKEKRTVLVSGSHTKMAPSEMPAKL